MDDDIDAGGWSYQPGFHDAFWTLEQVLAWVAIQDREVTGSMSTEWLKSISHDDARALLDQWNLLILNSLKGISKLSEVDARTKLAAAYQEVTRALQAGKLVATWKRPRQQRSEISRFHWADHRISRNAYGFLDVEGGDLNDDSQVRVSSEDVLTLWPDSPADRATSNEEKKAIGILADLMRKSPSSPTMTKEAALDWVKSQVPSLVGPRPSKRVWDEAVRLANAQAWTEPGRRPSANRNGTPTGS